MLIRNGADVNDIDYDGHTTLYRAAEVNSVKAIRVLLEAGADVNGFSQEWTPLNAACEANTAAAVTILAEHSADMSNIYDGHTSLQRAILHGFLRRDEGFTVVRCGPPTKNVARCAASYTPRSRVKIRISWSLCSSTRPT